MHLSTGSPGRWCKALAFGVRDAGSKPREREKGSGGNGGEVDSTWSFFFFFERDSGRETSPTRLVEDPPRQSCRQRWQFLGTLIPPNGSLIRRHFEKHVGKTALARAVYEMDYGATIEGGRREIMHRY